MNIKASDIYTKELISNFQNANPLGVIKDVLLIISTAFPDFITKPIFNFFYSFPLILSYLPLIIFSIFVYCSLLILRFCFRFNRSIKEQSVILEITPPFSSEKSPLSTQQLFSTIHGLGWDRSSLDKLLGKKPRFSFEIVSTQHQGIRYFIRTTPDLVNSLKRNLLSYMPQVTIKEVPDYLLGNFYKLNNFYTKIEEYKLSHSFAHPLQKQDTLKESDPISYMSGAMTKLSPGELISFQMVLSATQVKETDKIDWKIQNNDDPLGYLKKREYPILLKIIFSILKGILLLFTGIFSALAKVISEFPLNADEIKRTRAYEMESRLRMNTYKAQRIPTPYEAEIIEEIKGKIKDSLFDAKLRLLVISKEKRELNERVKGFNSSLKTFASPNQQLRAKRSIFNLLPLKAFMFKNRLLSLTLPRKDKFAQLLSISEVADLYHFPFSRASHAENMVKTHSNELPAPLSLKQIDKQFDVILGINTYGGVITKIGVTKDERARHKFVLGGTGTGKSTFISNEIIQDIKKGRGVIVIDPHGELADEILFFIPKKRWKDFVWINPDDLDHPAIINLLELPEGLTGNDLLREKQFVCESVVSLFRKIFSDEGGVWSAHAYRIEHILRNAIFTCFEIEDSTIFTVLKLLEDPKYRNGIVKSLKDEDLANFWKYYFGKGSDWQQVKMMGGIVARISEFFNSPAARKMLGKPKSTIDFDKLMNEGKIIVCKLARGELSEPTSELLGTVILNKIQLATLRRARVPADKRTPVYLYLDEFQYYATKSFVNMVSEGRKYGLNITLVQQTTAQQYDRNLSQIILANVGTFVVFRNASTWDEELMLPLFYPYIERGEIANLPNYKFFIKISAVKPEEPFSGETILPKTKKDMKKVKELIKQSQKLYTVTENNLPIKSNGNGQVKEKIGKESEVKAPVEQDSTVTSRYA